MKKYYLCNTTGDRTVIESSGIHIVRQVNWIKGTLVYHDSHNTGFLSSYNEQNFIVSGISPEDISILLLKNVNVYSLPDNIFQNTERCMDLIKFEAEGEYTIMFKGVTKQSILYSKLIDNLVI